MGGAVSTMRRTPFLNPVQSPYGIIDPDDPSIRIPAGIGPLLDVWMRDPRVTPGGDGWYYLTGTTRLPDGSEPNAGRWNDGIRLWRSRDLRAWEDMGLVWSLDRDATWQRDYHFPGEDGRPGRTVPPEEVDFSSIPGDLPVRRSVWAPELNYLPQRRSWHLSASMNFGMALPPERWAQPLFGGGFVLHSRSGGPQGPWFDPPGHPLTDRIDGQLFEDDDGSVWFVFMDGQLLRLNEQLDAVVEVRFAWQTNWPPSRAPIPLEGVSLFKHEGRYHLGLACNTRRRHDGAVGYSFGPDEARVGPRLTYDYVLASADHITGPYGPRYTVCIEGGHGHPFADFKGHWWLACFGNPASTGKEFFPMAERCRPYLVPLRWRGGRLQVDPSEARKTPCSGP